MPRKKQIAFAFRGGSPHLARTLQGILKYARERNDWNASFSPETPIISMENFQGWPGNGVIAFLRTESEVRAAIELNVPVVNLSGTLPSTEVPRVIVDYRTIGRLAAEHLMERGFQQFAFYGIKDMWYSHERKSGFIERLEREGFKCSVLESPGGDTSQPWRHWIDPLERWLPTLEQPVGLLAVHDSRAALVAEACFNLGFHVPHDVAIIGINNEHFTCEMSQVPLTSVSRNDYKVGYAAASLLDDMIDGIPRPEKDILIPPNGIIVRRSTNTFAVTDRRIANLVRYIDEHINESFGVERLEKLVPFSRSSLEQRFKNSLQCTPHEYITRARVRWAEELLSAKSVQTLKQIASACGFGDSRRFRIVFKQLTGLTPAEYRRCLTEP